jgi:poly(beta-D-mannuronate) lyase
MNRWVGRGLVLVFLGGTPALFGATVDVASTDELKKAVENAAPGDHIVVADGKYTSSGAITVARAGTAERPIVIGAKTVGGVEIAGDGGFKLEKPAAYVVVKGFVFTHKAGAMSLGGGVHHCRVTRNVFALKVDGRATYLDVLGDDNEIDHNTFRDKDTEGQMLYVQGPGGDAMAQRTWVHHNYFLDFKPTGKNNATGLHIGSSWRSMSSAYSVAEYNLFVRNRGENEGAICNKSSDNIYRYNTIVDCTELSLRHGHRVEVYGNLIIDSSGVRFFAWDHRIFGNYFEGCRPAISVGNGDATIPPGQLTAHQRPDRVLVVYNTLVNNRSNVQMQGRKNGLGAEDLVFADNLIVGGNKAVTIGGPLARAKWQGNIVWNTEGGAGDLPESGFTAIDPKLVKDDHGVWRLSAGSAAIGKGVGAYSFVEVDIDGQPRPDKGLDVGADQFSATGPTRHPLTEVEVGPKAPDEGDRPLIWAPKAEWIPKAPPQ